MRKDSLRSIATVQKLEKSTEKVIAYRLWNNFAMIRCRIPNDNCCLFSAIDFLVSDGIHRPNAASELRRKCIQQISSNQQMYSEVYLGKSNQDYCQWLALDSSWGGEVEIVILAEQLKVEITVVSIEFLTLLSYSPNYCKDFKRIYILYTGQHYDALIDNSAATSRYSFAVSENTQTEEMAIACAREHRDEWERQLKTRTRKRLKCAECCAIVKDSEEFQKHCITVDHSDDFAYECEEIEVPEIVDNADDE